MIDDDVIEGYRAKAEAAGCGYQTLMNEILRAALAEDDRPVTAKMLRKILREELRDDAIERPSSAGAPSPCSGISTLPVAPTDFLPHIPAGSPCSAESLPAPQI